MTHVHYKFSSKLSYDTVVFDGPNFTLLELKRQIMEREKLRVGYCDLQITNAQTKQEYENDQDLIPKGTSVIVRRIPIAGVKSGLSCSKTFSIDSSDVSQLHHLPGADRSMDNKSSSKEALFFSEIANLAHADVTEEEKIQVVLTQSSLDSVNYKFGNNLPASYTCYRCGNAGHHIRNCPNSKQEKNSETPVKLKKSTGIPRSFMVEVDDPTLKGAMLTNCGRYAIPTIDAAAYAIGKKEKPAFVSKEPLEPEEEEDPVPDELLCLICRDLLNDAVVIPCCGNSYCDDCIRTTLLDSEEHVCPTCSQSDVSPDTLIANKFLRQAVNTFKREQGKIKTLGKSCAASQSKNPTPTLSPTPTPPPLTQPQKIKQPIQSPQDLVQPCSPAEVTDTQPLSQESETSPTAAAPASPSNSPGRSLQTEQVNLDLTEFDSGSADAEVKKQDESAAAAADASPSGLVTDSLDPPSSQLEPSFDQTQSDQQKSSSGSWSESKPQPPSSSSSAYPTPPPLFPPPHLLPFQPLNGYPPGYPPATPVWTFPTLKGAPTPPLPSTSSIPTLMPSDWYMYQRRRRERSPHRGSTYSHSSKSSKSKSSHSYHSSRSKSRSRSKDRSRSSHRGSTNSHSSQSSKSKSSYSHPSSRSRSRSRSKSRLRPQSSSSRHRDHHSSSHYPKTYSYGYKRLHSPTTSSSSSPRAGYHSRHESLSDHRHHRKKSSTSSSRSRRGGDHYHREEGVPAGYVYPQYADQMSSLELDQQRYLQWKREYKDWCEKYLDSYLEHFHQLPPLPPCPFPAGTGRERRRKRSNSRGRHHSRQTSRIHHRSPPSSDSRSLSSQSSSSNSSTKSSRSSHYSSSSSSHSSTDNHSPHSQTRSQSHSPQPEQDSSRPNPFTEQNEKEELKECSKDHEEKNLEDLSNLKHKKADFNEHEQSQEKETLPPDAVDFMDDSGKDKSHDDVPDPFNDAPSKEIEVTNNEALDSEKQQIEPDKCLKKDYKQKSNDTEDKDGEKQKKRDRYSDSRRDSDRRHKDRSSRRKHRVDEDKFKDHKSSESRSEMSRKRKDEMERRTEKADSTKCQEIRTKVDLEYCRVEPQFQFEGKKRKSEKYERKTQPLSEQDIWEEGIKVKAQRKISINIKIDTKKNEETQNMMEEKSGGGEIERVNKGEAEVEKDTSKDSNRDEEKVEMKAERATKQIWMIKNIRDGKAEMSESSSGEKTDVRSKREDSEYEELDKWSCGEDEDKNKNLPADTMESQSEEVTNMNWRAVIEEKEEERSVRGDNQGQEMGGMGLGDEEERHEKENPGNETTGNLSGELEPKEEVERGKEMHERDASVPTSQRSRSESDHDGLETSIDDISYDDCKERKMVVKTLEEYTENRTVDEEEKLILIQVPLSKWEKSEDEELQPAPPVSVTAGTTSTKEPERENEHHRQRSVEKERDRSTERVGGRDREKNLQRSLASSSGKYRHDSPSCSDRERRGSQRESMKSKERAREEDRSRGKEREKEKRRNLPPLSHSHSYPRSCDADRRERHREERKKSSSAPSENHSGGRSRDTKQPDRNSLKTDRNMSPDSKPKDKDRPRHSWERDKLSSASSRESEISKSRSSSPGRESRQSRSRDETKVQMQKISKDRREHEGWRPVEKEERDEKMRRKCGPTDDTKRMKMEDAEWLSSRSSSNSSSSSRESSRNLQRGREETRK